MVMEKKIKVVWICIVSNSTLRSRLELGLPKWRKLMSPILNKKLNDIVPDSAQWNTNALEEFEKIDDVNLHVIFVHPKMLKFVQRFKIDNINYYAVSNGDSSFWSFLKLHFAPSKMDYKRTWRAIVNLVEEIKPEIIHVMGAENPVYSESILFLPNKIPVLVQLQTMLHESVAIQSNPQLKYQKACERDVLMRADYIGSKSKRFPGIVREYIKKDAVFVNARLLVAENANIAPCDKQFDFVYFASYINKSIDLAIEAFGIAHHENPNLTLDVIGGTSESEMQALTARMEELGCKEAVFFEGKLPTHEDVMKQIRKARFALLPLKIDIVSGTIREAMWNGIPVVSTITVGTPRLNKNRESLLISPIGDHEAMAANMLRLANDSELADQLRMNAATTIEEVYGDNTTRAHEWVEVYRACIDNFKNGTPLPDHILNKN